MSFMSWEFLSSGAAGFRIQEFRGLGLGSLWKKVVGFGVQGFSTLESTTDFRIVWDFCLGQRLRAGAGFWLDLSGRSGLAAV